MQKYLYLFIVLFLFSCSNTKTSDNDSNKIDSINVGNEVVEADYEFLQGENIEESNKILIVVIDPHGDGKLAISKFQKVIDNYNCTVIALNDVQNNQQDFMYQIKNDVNAAIENLQLDVEQIYFAGFSGGAKMAFYFAYENQASGVLMSGANVPEIWANYDFPLAMIVGNLDFNYSIMYYPPFDPTADENILSFVFEGIHEWASEDYIYKAFTFLFSKNEIDISNFNYDFVQESQSYLNGNKDYLSYKSLEAGYKIYEDENIKSKLDKFGENEKFNQYMQNFHQILYAGAARNSEYLKMLPTKNIDWWTNEIADIEELSNDSDILVANSYKRTKAFLGMAMFSYVANEINNPNSLVIDKYLQIYELLEPENPDLWFYKSFRQIQLGDATTSENYLKKAFEYGYTDTLRAIELGLM